ncbi:MAG TPA: hypothetical protein VLT84_10405 [Acidobacteriota bacterium]|nr:hypothetical protein [Acidobacteriota bacterium]
MTPDGAGVEGTRVPRTWVAGARRTALRGVRAVGARLPALVAVLVLALAPGCTPDTSTLTPEWTKRFETEGIVRRADNVVVRHTRLAGPYDKGYKDRLASVLVTRGTVLIHQGDRVLLEITPRTRRRVEVRRDGSRVRIRAIGERVTEVFSFEPREDRDGWLDDVRAVADLSREAAKRSA